MYWQYGSSKAYTACKTPLSVPPVNPIDILSLFIASLNSGSNGNCYYVGNEADAVLIDAGLSCRETEKRMARLGLSLDKVRAVFISHEHSDHIRGLEVLARKYGLPVYITPATLANSRLVLAQDLVYTFLPHVGITIGSLTVLPFPKFHDASDPHSFVVSGNAVHIGVFTDIGFCCEDVVRYFAQCHAVFLEANYDEEMLEQGRYPWHLKNRIRGGRGHLSNGQSLELFRKHKPAYMTHILLAHLSKDNNSPEMVRELFASHAGTTFVEVASRYQETDVFEITADTAATMPVRPKKIQLEVIQLTLFD